MIKSWSLFWTTQSGYSIKRGLNLSHELIFKTIYFLQQLSSTLLWIFLYKNWRIYAPICFPISRIPSIYLYPSTNAYDWPENLDQISTRCNRFFLSPNCQLYFWKYLACSSKIIEKAFWPWNNIGCEWNIDS